MIEVVFLGVGEAFDEALPNTSILIRFGAGNSPVTVLLDCGFTAPPCLWKEAREPDSLDAIWISHFHGDHALGLPSLLVRSWEEGRGKPLLILGQKGTGAFTRQAVDLAYPGFYGKLAFPIKFVEIEPGENFELLGLTFGTAETNHSQRNLALRIDARGKSIYYSGDGKPTPESMLLAQGCHLIIHEAFHMETELPTHGTVMGSVDTAKRSGAAHLALVHIQRKARTQVIENLERLGDLAGSAQLMVPEPGDRTTL
jgi:ribonuclease BN (tRNA processing enzyme)